MGISFKVRLKTIKTEHPRTHVTLFIDIILLTIDITLKLTNSTAIPLPWYGNDCLRRQVTFSFLWFVCFGLAQIRSTDKHYHFTKEIGQ